MNYLKNSRVIILIAFCFSSSCCSSPTANTQDSQLIWSKSITNGGLIFGSMPVTYTSKGILYLGMEGNIRTLFFLEKNSGNVIWKWTNYFIDGEGVAIQSVYQYQNSCVFYNIGNIYAINIDNGNTIWRLNRRGDGIAATSGLGNTFFYANFLNVERGNIVNGMTNNIFSIAEQSGYRVAVKPPTPLIAQNGDTMLITIRSSLRLIDASPGQANLILYNLSKNQFVYDTVTYGRQSSGNPVLSNQKIYNDVGGGIQCNDLWTGKLLWRRDFDVSFLFSGVEVAEGKVFAGGEDTNFYCLDAETGNTLWTLKGVAGGTRKPFVMNGVVYFANGSLYAVDVNTGQILSKPYSPDGEGFFGRVTGSDGRIYAQSYKSAYCYKAAR